MSVCAGDFSVLVCVVWCSVCVRACVHACVCLVLPQKPKNAVRLLFGDVDIVIFNRSLVYKLLSSMDDSCAEGH